MMLPCGCYVDKRGRKIATCPTCNGNKARSDAELLAMQKTPIVKNGAMVEAWKRRKDREASR